MLLTFSQTYVTYASPIWWNMNAAKAEKLCKFERTCLRACLHIYRRTNTKHFISNRANIPRIGLFILQLTRDYLANIKKVNNDTLQTLTTINENECKAASRSGYLAPHMFMFHHRNRIIQDLDNVPLIYHIPRSFRIKESYTTAHSISRHLNTRHQCLLRSRKRSGEVTKSITGS